MTDINDSADMRPPYFVPDRFSPLLSDAQGGSVYFSMTPYESEDLYLRILCGRACVLLARGMPFEEVYKCLKIEDIPYFEQCFVQYNGINPHEYSLWVRSLK